jgi:hypothetical protein
MTALTHALKEWSVAVNALEQGKTILLLRKGGIRESGRQFQVPYQKVLLYPTLEHQKSELLKPEYSPSVIPTEPGWHPDSVELRVWATITHHFVVTDSAIVDCLYPYHVWNQQFIHDRLSWQPGAPLNLLLLRVFRLSQPLHLAYQPSFGGCRSWFDLTSVLQNGVMTAGSWPVLSDSEYQPQVALIQTHLEPFNSDLRATLSK